MTKSAFDKAIADATAKERERCIGIVDYERIYGGEPATGNVLLSVSRIIDKIRAGAK